jgi:hypothetical protein
MSIQRRKTRKINPTNGIEVAFVHHFLVVLKFEEEILGRIGVKKPFLTAKPNSIWIL